MATKSLSVDEVNKMRAALGMPLIPTGNDDPNAANLNFKPSESTSDDEEPASTLETRQAAAHDNWKKLQNEADEKKRREERREKLKKDRDAAQRFAKLEGKGLGDADGDEIDTRSWLLGQNKRQKKISKERDRAKNVERELAEREKQIQYTEKDLAGKRVGHELGAFDDDDGEHILTLKDAAVDDEDEDDELENMDLRERERIKDRLEVKKGRVYDPIADEEAGKGNFLSQYDDKEQQRFTLDGSGKTREEINGASNATDGGPKGVKVSLDIIRDDKPISDYQDISEVKIRKSKKKKGKSKRKRDDGELQEEEEAVKAAPEVTVDADFMDVEAPPSDLPKTKTKRKYDEDFADDDDLQSTLALTRLNTLKKRKVKVANEIAAEKEEGQQATLSASTPSAMQVDSEEGRDTGLVLDETSEFVVNFDSEARPIAVPKALRRGSDSTPAANSPAEASDGDVDMDKVYNDLDDDEDLAARVKRESSSLAPEKKSIARHSEDDALDEEGGVSKGVGGTLKMLVDRGILQRNEEATDRNTDFVERQRFLREKQLREDRAQATARSQREQDRHSGRFTNMSAREREQYAQKRNEERDQQDSRRMAESFNREYKPDIELNYVDEFGRAMTQREAFKHLSHQFHGKGSGKMKTEKRLKKIADEKKRMAQASLDTNQQKGMNRAMNTATKKTQTAGVRLA